MSTRQAWHSTHWGRACLFLGSIRLAVPVLAVVSGVLIWGTWIESTTSGTEARARVYGSWWFIGLMGLVCVILVTAVITRYPWKRKHTGFIVVHASLIALIFGGFWSLFARVEGQLWLQEGTSGNVLETSRLQIERLNQVNGQSAPGEYALIDGATRTASVAGLRIRIVDHWANSVEQREVVNDGGNPFQAIEVVVDPMEAEGLWVGQTLDDQAWTASQDLRIRMMPLGVRYTPPDGSALGSDDYTFVVSGERVPVPEVGQELLPGWTVESVRRFRHAAITANGLEEGTNDRENPALEVVLNDGSGTLERHVAYKKYPDTKIHRPIQGEAESGATLEAPAGERIVFESIDGKLRATHVAASGEIGVIPQIGALPWTVSFGNRSLTIRRHFDHARSASHLVEAPAADRSMPVLVVRVEGGADQDIPLRWNTPTPVATRRGVETLRYGRHVVPLPFSIQLDDFRKIDYPGSEMAMAFESDVRVTTRDKTESLRIFMNNPYKYGGWKVYQSGFDGDSISVFSIMKDPGLPLTYAGCIGLCVGIFLTFYAGGLSWGHPGIPVPFAERRRANAPQTDTAGDAGADWDGRGAAVARSDRIDADPGGGADDAPGHVREGNRGPTHGAIEVVSEARS